MEGTGSFEVVAIGSESYAERLAGTAREFRHPRSPLERAIDRLLYVLLTVMVPLGAMLIVALEKQDVAIGHAVDTAVAGMVTLIPEGLILLVSVTYAAAAMRMARAGALSQQLNAIESLASVDTVCIDKTGTLTEPSLRLVALLPAAGSTEQELAERPWPLRRCVRVGERHAHCSRTRAAGPVRDGRRVGPLSLTASLERSEGRRRPLRPRGTGALHAR